MLDEKKKFEFAAQLKRYLANPSAVMPLYEQYSEGKSGYSFGDYTHELEDLLENLNTGKFKKQEEFCKEIERLHLPHNQFDCK